MFYVHLRPHISALLTDIERDTFDSEFRLTGCSNKETEDSQVIDHHNYILNLSILWWMSAKLNDTLTIFGLEEIYQNLSSGTDFNKISHIYKMKDIEV
jgi:hypothetical protein